MIRIAVVAALLGLLIGFVGGWQTKSWWNDAQTLRQVHKTIKANTAETSRRETIADQHAAKSEAIEQEREQVNADYETYLDSRPDVRAFDLGPEWLCLADKAAGVAEPRCPGEPQTGVPKAASAEGLKPAGNTTSVPASAGAVPDLRGSPSQARSSDQPKE